MKGNTMTDPMPIIRSIVLNLPMPKPVINQRTGEFDGAASPAALATYARWIAENPNPSKCGFEQYDIQDSFTDAFDAGVRSTK